MSELTTEFEKKAQELDHLLVQAKSETKELLANPLNGDSSDDDKAIRQIPKKLCSIAVEKFKDIDPNRQATMVENSFATIMDITTNGPDAAKKLALLALPEMYVSSESLFATAPLELVSAEKREAIAINGLNLLIDTMNTSNNDMTVVCSILAIREIISISEKSLYSILSPEKTQQLLYVGLAALVDFHKKSDAANVVREKKQGWGPQNAVNSELAYVLTKSSLLQTLDPVLSSGLVAKAVAQTISNNAVIDLLDEPSLHRHLDALKHDPADDVIYLSDNIMLAKPLPQQRVGHVCNDGFLHLKSLNGKGSHFYTPDGKKLAKYYGINSSEKIHILDFSPYHEVPEKHYDLYVRNGNNSCVDYKPLPENIEPLPTHILEAYVENLATFNPFDPKNLKPMSLGVSPIKEISKVDPVRAAYHKGLLENYRAAWEMNQKDSTYKVPTTQKELFALNV